MSPLVGAVKAMRCWYEMQPTWRRSHDTKGGNGIATSGCGEDRGRD